MRAIVETSFRVVLDGQVHGVEVQPGDELTGEAAESCIRQGFGFDPDAEPEPVEADAGETEPVDAGAGEATSSKRPKGKKSAPENKGTTPTETA